MQFPSNVGQAGAGYEVANLDDEEMVADHGGISSSADAFSYGTVAPLAGPSIGGDNIIDAIGETSDYLVLQMEVDNTASPGNLTDETFTFRYDEI